MPASPSSRRLNTVVVTPELISPTKPEMPSWQLWPSSLAEGRWRTNCTLFFFLKKWRLQMEMLMMGDTAVASAAPASPRPMGNIKM